jgi:hypothetical protein
VRQGLLKWSYQTMERTKLSRNKKKEHQSLYHCVTSLLKSRAYCRSVTPHSSCSVKKSCGFQIPKTVKKTTLKREQIRDYNRLVRCYRVHHSVTIFGHPIPVLAGVFRFEFCTCNILNTLVHFHPTAVSNEDHKTGLTSRPAHRRLSHFTLISGYD